MGGREQLAEGFSGIASGSIIYFAYDQSSARRRVVTYLKMSEYETDGTFTTRVKWWEEKTYIRGNTSSAAAAWNDAPNIATGDATRYNIKDSFCVDGTVSCSDQFVVVMVLNAAKLLECF